MTTIAAQVQTTVTITKRVSFRWTEKEIEAILREQATLWLQSNGYFKEKTKRIEIDFPHLYDGSRIEASAVVEFTKEQP